jgi:hypothetical protein
MPALEYDMRVIGMRKIEQAFGQLERRLNVHNQRVSRALGDGGSSGRPRQPGAGGLSAEARASERAQLASERRVAAERMRNERRVFAEREREARRSVRQQIRDEQTLERARTQGRLNGERRLAQQAAGRRSQLRRGLVAGAGGVASVGRGAMGLAGIGGGAYYAMAASQAIGYESRTRQLLANSRGAGEGMMMDPRAMQGRVRNTAIASGLDQGDIIGGLEAFVAKTGNLETAMAMMADFGTIAKATGASFEDVASAGADIFEKFKISKAEDMRDAMASLVFQGKQGAFELRDMASQFPKVAAIAESIGLTGTGGVRQLGGLLQVARSATGSAEQATFAVDATIRQLIAKASEMKSGKAFGGKRKVNVFEGGDPTAGVRDINELLTDVVAATGGNMVQLQNIFGSEGIRALRPLVSKYKQAGGGDAGKQAVAGFLGEKSNTTGAWSEIEKDKAFNMASAATQFTVASTRLSEKVQTDLVPALVSLMDAAQGLVPLFGKATEALAGFVGWFASNPEMGIATVVGGALAKEMAGVGGPVGLAAAAAISGAIAAAYQASALADDLRQDGSQDVAAWQDMADRVTARLTSGDATAADVRNAQFAQKKLAELQGQQSAVSGASLLDLAGNSAASLFGRDTGPGVLDVFRQGGAAEQMTTGGGAKTAARLASALETFNTKGVEAANRFHQAFYGAAAGTVNRGNSPTVPSS